MNQTVTINISGIVYHIEIDAYETLKNYLQKIKSYFSDSEEREEIMQDIEARIAELFNEILTSKNQVLTEKNIADLIVIMGKPAQYISEEDNDHPNFESAKKRVGEKKLFRNPDERIFGGVSSGLAANIGIDTVWVRLSFVAAFFMGFGVLIYIILWIVIPEAKTVSDKLKMKGEPINFKNIGKKIEDEATFVNEKIKNINPTNFIANIGLFIERIAKAILSILTSVFNVIGKFVGIIMLFFGSITLLLLIIFVLGSSSIISISSNGFLSVETIDLVHLIYNSENDIYFGLVGLLLTIGIPLVAIILFAIKILFNVKMHFSIALSLLGFFIFGVVLCGWMALNTAKEFSSKQYVLHKENISTTASTLLIKTSAKELPGVSVLEDKYPIINTSNDSLFIRLINFNIKKSPTDSMLIETKYSAHGRNFKNAKRNSKMINYNYKITDSIIVFDNYLSTFTANKLRGQKVSITLYLPLNKIVYLDNSIKKMLFDVDNLTNTTDKKMVAKKWIMLPHGLTCMDCNDVKGISQQQFDSLTNYNKVNSIY